ncbi:hypothetical protein E4S40_10820 [Algoriphagus kandeliae]|uniref:Uncharacterized protein n=1 Tax=Algoriphagus kandeliae TaxID=2562278 RepID=A0A4Y9QPE9_9BACT|nr:hypothetical protein [Algoriphagus kandeliae]TFV94504.1 hypothetical protein E4S40_10820 [Algoriphagus kandeliae]
MSIRRKADWLRGYLESIEDGGNVSNRQIEVLKEKLNLLLSEIEEYFYEDNEDDFDEARRHETTMDPFDNENMPM